MDGRSGISLAQIKIPVAMIIKSHLSFQIHFHTVWVSVGPVGIFVGDPHPQ